MPSERDGSREHIPYIHKKEIWGFSEAVGKNDHKVTPFSTMHCNSLVHKGSMDGITALFNC